MTLTAVIIAIVFGLSTLYLFHLLEKSNESFDQLTESYNQMFNGRIQDQTLHSKALHNILEKAAEIEKLSQLQEQKIAYYMKRVEEEQKINEQLRKELPKDAHISSKKLFSVL